MTPGFLYDIPPTSFLFEKHDAFVNMTSLYAGGELNVFDKDRHLLLLSVTIPDEELRLEEEPVWNLIEPWKATVLENGRATNYTILFENGAFETGAVSTLAGKGGLKLENTDLEKGDEIALTLFRRRGQ